MEKQFPLIEKLGLKIVLSPNWVPVIEAIEVENLLKELVKTESEKILNEVLESVDEI